MIYAIEVNQADLDRMIDANNNKKVVKGRRQCRR